MGEFLFSKNRPLASAKETARQPSNCHAPTRSVLKVRLSWRIGWLPASRSTAWLQKMQRWRCGSSIDLLSGTRDVECTGFRYSQPKLGLTHQALLLNSRSVTSRKRQLLDPDC